METPTRKQIDYIAILLRDNPEKSKTIERIYNELYEQLNDRSFLGNFILHCKICDILAKKIKTKQEANYIISCIKNQYTNSKGRLVQKFRELNLIEMEEEFMLDKMAMAVNYN